MNDLPDAIALAHRLRGSVTIAVARMASVESAVPYDEYIAASATGATPHSAITRARPSVLELAPTGSGLSFPGEADRLNIPVDGWNQALFDAHNHPDRHLYRSQRRGNALPQDPMSLGSPSRDVWTGSSFKSQRPAFPWGFPSVRPPVASGRLRSPPVASGRLRSPPVASGRLRSPPVASGRLRSPLVASGRLRSPPVDLARQAQFLWAWGWFGWCLGGSRWVVGHCFSARTRFRD